MIREVGSLTFKVLGTLRNIGLVAYGALFMKEPLGGLEYLGYGISLAGFVAYSHFKMTAPAAAVNTAATTTERRAGESTSGTIASSSSSTSTPVSPFLALPPFSPLSSSSSSPSSSSSVASSSSSSSRGEYSSEENDGSCRSEELSGLLSNKRGQGFTREEEERGGAFTRDACLSWESTSEVESDNDGGS